MISSHESCLGSDPSFSRLLPHCGAFPFVIGVHPSGGLPREPWCTEIKSPIAPLSSRLPRETCELYLFLRAWLPMGLLPAAGWDWRACFHVWVLLALSVTVVPELRVVH